MIHYTKYICPSCKFQTIRDIDYPHDLFTDKDNNSMPISTWCWRCGITHLYEITIRKLKNKEYKITTHYFLCDGERTPTKLELTEQPVKGETPWRATPIS